MPPTTASYNVQMLSIRDARHEPAPVVRWGLAWMKEQTRHHKARRDAPSRYRYMRRAPPRKSGSRDGRAARSFLLETGLKSVPTLDLCNLHALLYPFIDLDRLIPRRIGATTFFCLVNIIHQTPERPRTSASDPRQGASRSPPAHYITSHNNGSRNKAVLRTDRGAEDDGEECGGCIASFATRES